MQNNLKSCQSHNGAKPVQTVPLFNSFAVLLKSHPVYKEIKTQNGFLVLSNTVDVTVNTLVFILTLMQYFSYMCLSYETEPYGDVCSAALV